MAPNPERHLRVAEAQEMRKQGLSTSEIAQRLGVSRSSAQRYIFDPTGQKHVKSQTKYWFSKGKKLYRLNKGKPPLKEEAEHVYNRTDIPVSQEIRMRPVWRRRQSRIYGNVNDLPPPTDEEKGDAILVLEDQSMEKHAPALWYEAFRIFEEASA